MNLDGSTQRLKKKRVSVWQRKELKNPKLHLDLEVVLTQKGH